MLRERLVRIEYTTEVAWIDAFDEDLVRDSRRSRVAVGADAADRADMAAEDLDLPPQLFASLRDQSVADVLGCEASLERQPGQGLVVEPDPASQLLDCFDRPQRARPPAEVPSSSNGMPGVDPRHLDRGRPPALGCRPQQHVVLCPAGRREGSG